MELSYAAVCFDLFGTLVEEDGHPIAGARDALLAVPRDRCAIVTSCGLQFARILLRTAQLPEPPVVIASEHVERGKPAPDSYALAVERLGVEDPGTVLALEDSRHGMSAARAAGLDVIGVLAGRPPSYAQEALYTVERLADISWTRTDAGTIVVRF